MSKVEKIQKLGAAASAIAAQKSHSADKLNLYIKVAADSIEALRKVDVYRVLDAVRADNIDGVTRAELASFIARRRPDLGNEVAEVMLEEFPADIPSDSLSVDPNHEADSEPTEATKLPEIVWEFNGFGTEFAKINGVAIGHVALRVRPDYDDAYEVVLYNSAGEKDAVSGKTVPAAITHVGPGQDKVRFLKMVEEVLANGTPSDVLTTVLKHRAPSETLDTIPKNLSDGCDPRWGENGQLTREQVLVAKRMAMNQFFDTPASDDDDYGFDRLMRMRDKAEIESASSGVGYVTDPTDPNNVLRTGDGWNGVYLGQFWKGHELENIQRWVFSRAVNMIETFTGMTPKSAFVELKRYGTTTNRDGLPDSPTRLNLTEISVKAARAQSYRDLSKEWSPPPMVAPLRRPRA